MPRTRGIFLAIVFLLMAMPVILLLICVSVFLRNLLSFYRISMTRVFDVQELDRVEFLTMFCSNSKGGLLNFRATIRDGRDVLSIHLDKAESVDLGTVSSEFRQFIHYLCAYTYSDSYTVADLNNTASDSIF